MLFVKFGNVLFIQLYFSFKLDLKRHYNVTKSVL